MSLSRHSCNFRRRLPLSCGVGAWRSARNSSSTRKHARWARILPLWPRRLKRNGSAKPMNAPLSSPPVGRVGMRQKSQSISSSPRLAASRNPAFSPFLLFLRVHFLLPLCVFRLLLLLLLLQLPFYILYPSPFPSPATSPYPYPFPSPSPA